MKIYKKIFKEAEKQTEFKTEFKPNEIVNVLRDFGTDRGKKLL